MRARALAVVLALAGSGAAPAAEPSGGGKPLDAVVMALKWDAQFQFAGFYAAKARGFYEEEGLDVAFTTPADGLYPVEAVRTGKAHFGVTSGDLVPARAQGHPVVALAVLFQHSPLILMSRKDRNLAYLSDYAGRKIMGSPDDRPEILAMFRQEGIDPEPMEFVPLAGSVDALAAGEVDATIDYLSNEPYVLRQRGVEPRIIRPIDYGIDFYGDTLFTTEEEIRRHPERVAGFRRATLRGWEYAFAHPEEMIDRILELPGVRARGKTRDHLRYEAEQLAHLAQARMIEVGHMNPARWERIARTYEELGLIPPGFSMEGFLYRPEPARAGPGRWARAAGAAGAAVGLLALLGVLWNHRLRRAVRRKTRDLQDSESRWKSYVEGAPYGIFVVEGQWRCLDANPAACALSGLSRDQLRDRSLRDLLAPEGHEAGDRHFAALQRDGQAAGELPVQTPAGGPRWWSVAARRIDENRYIAFCEDVTERKQTAELLFHSQKMESIGLLAGGVAHDFNNMLAVILGNAEIAIGQVLPGRPPHAELLEIRKAAERSAALTRQLLGFARKQTVRPRRLDLNATIDGLFEMLRRLVGESVAMEWQPGPEPLPVRLDPSQIDQLLINLCVNARDAVGPDGRIAVATGAARFDGRTRAMPAGGPAGDFVWVSVTDNGRGIEEKQLPHIFEPFFTTKGVGKGTGLGLATVYGIVRQNEGFISVDSAPGRGTVFTLYFPRLDAEEAAGPTPAAEEGETPGEHLVRMLTERAAHGEE